MKYNFYFDRIRINSFLPKDIVNQIVNVFEIEKHCRAIEIGRPYKVAQRHGYESRIELYQATDEAIRLLQRYDLWEHGISRIEIARDIVCNNSLVSNKYRSIFQNNHYLKWGTRCFFIGNTEYLGKIERKNRGLYAVCYNPIKVKLGCSTVVHVEFVLSGKKSISKKLGIDTIYDIVNAQDCFTRLSDKFLVEAKVNQSRIKKHFPDKKIQNVAEMVEFITTEKERIRERKYRHHIFYTICDKRLRKRFGLKKMFTFTKKEQLILNQSVRYWINEG